MGLEMGGGGPGLGFWFESGGGGVGFGLGGLRTEPGGLGWDELGSGLAGLDWL